MFGLGPLEMVIILAAALVFIGPGKLPEVARSLGKGMREMRRAVAGFEGEIQRATTPLDESEAKAKAPPVPDPDSHEGLFPPDDPRAANEQAEADKRAGDTESEPAEGDGQETKEEGEPGPPDRVAQVQARPVRPATTDEAEETSDDASATEGDVPGAEDRADTPEPV